MKSPDSSMDLEEAMHLELEEYDAHYAVKPTPKSHMIAIAALMLVPVTVVALIIFWPKLPPWNVLH